MTKVSNRLYVRGDRFEPLFLKPDPASYLSQLRSISDGIVTQEETWIGQLPAFDTVRGLPGASTPATCAPCSRPFTTDRPSKSNTSPFPAPPLVGAGSRRMRSRSTVSAGMPGRTALPTAASRTSCWRASSASGAAAPVISMRARTWTGTHVTLEIGPHPGLSDAQKKVVALDYGMRDGKAKLSVRKALLYYTLKRLGPDANPEARKPADQQIVLLSQQVFT